MSLKESRVNRFYLVCTVFIGCCSLACGQKVELNQEGYRIIKYEDGSWRYYQPADSIYLNSSSTLSTDTGSSESSTTNIGIQELVEKLALKAKFERSKYSNAQAKKLYLQNQLDLAKQSPGPKQQSRLDQLNNDLDEIKSKEKEYKKSYKRAQKWADNGLNILHESAEDQRSFIAKYNEYDRTARLSLVEDVRSETSVTLSDNEQIFDRTQLAIDIFKSPPAIKCNVDESFDELTGVKRMDTSRRLLLEHSPEKLMPYLKGEPYVRAYSYLTAVRGYVLLNLDVVISTDKAVRTIGGIERDAEIIFQFLDGTRAVVNNRISTQGRVDPLKKNTSFLLQCEVNKNLEKIFAKQLLDKIIINWKRGYQEYPIFQVDHFHHSFNCLKEGV